MKKEIIDPHRIDITSGYAGSTPKITIRLADGEKYIIEMDEAKRILSGCFSKGFETKLSPRQQYKRIYSINN